MLVGDDLVDVLLVPIAGVRDDRLRELVTPIRSSSFRVAVTIGSSCEKSVEVLVISAASTICCSLTAACALYPCANPNDTGSDFESGSVMFTLPAGTAGGSYGFGPRLSRRPLVARGRPVMLIGRVGTTLDVKL